MAIANKNDLTHVVRTTQQWESSYDKYECIPEGVLCIEFTTSGQALAKIGNGRDIFSKLPYIGGADLTNYFTKEQTTECINDILKAKRYICIKGILNNKNQLPTNATCGDLYFVISQNQSSSNKYDEYVYSPSNTWETLGSIPIDIDLSEYAKIVYVDEKIGEVNERIDDIEQHGTHTHANKDILDLITAAFTAEEKDKLSTLYNYDDTELRELITQASHTHSNKDILDAISAPFTKEDKSKLDQLNPYDDSILKEKIQALERLAHEHSNKRILDRTTASFTTEYERKMRWIRLYTGCTGMEEGIAGLVPAAQAGEEDYVLSGSGEWVPQTGGGGTYELPVASASVLGGIKVGDGLEIDENGVLSATGGGGGDSIAEGEGINITTDPQTGIKTISVDTGNGLQINQDGEVEIDPSIIPEVTEYSSGEAITIRDVSQILPAGYVEVDYIEGVGNYAVINYIPNRKTKIVGTASQTQTSYDPVLFGNRTGSAGQQFVFWFNRYDSTQAKVGFVYGTNTWSTSSDCDSGKLIPYTLGDQFTFLISLDDEFNINDSFVHNITENGAPASNLKLGIFALVNSSSDEIESSDQIFRGRMYEFKIYEDDELVVNLIPAVSTSTNQSGFYDVINDIFYTSKTATPFGYDPSTIHSTGKVIEVNYGNGLTVNQDNELEVNIGDGLSVNANNEVELSKATANDLGGIKVGSGFVYTSDGLLNATPAAPPFDVGDGLELIYDDIDALPNGYGHVDYVCSNPENNSINANGRARTLIDYVPTNTTKLAIKMQRDSERSDLCFIGSRIASRDHEFCFWNEYDSVTELAFSYGNTNYSNAYVTYSSYITGQIIEVECVVGDTSNTLSVNGTVVKTYTKDGDASPYKLGIFQIYLNESWGHQTANGKIYYIKLYEGNTLAVNLIPAVRLVDEVVGFYDNVNDKFYTSNTEYPFTTDMSTLVIDGTHRTLKTKLGNGLQFDENNAIEVIGGGSGGDTVEAGDGIDITTDSQTGNKVISIDTGNGLQINQDGELEIDPSIIPDSYDAGNGIEITEVTHEDEFRVQNQEYFFDTHGLTCGLNARVWTTVNDGDILAAMCIHNNGGNQVPLFVGLTENSVKVSQNYDSNILGPNGSFDYLGKTWYFTADYALSGTDGQDTQNHIQTLPTTYSFNSTPSNFVPAAKDLIDLAVLLPDTLHPTISAKIGTGLSFDANGAIQADAQPLSPATDSTLGGVIVGEGINVDEYGEISLSAGEGLDIDFESPLPSEYTLVKGISSTANGNQYINTGYKIKPTTVIKMTCTIYKRNASQWSIPLGTRNSNNTAYGGLLFVTCWQGSSPYDIPSLWIEGDTSGTASSSDAGLFYNDIIELTFTNNSVTCYNTRTEDTIVLTASSASVSQPVSYDLFIFATNDVGTAHFFGVMDLYSLQIFEGSTKLYDYIPCQRNSDNKYGLYDIINDEFKLSPNNVAFSYVQGTPTALDLIQQIKLLPATENTIGGVKPGDGILVDNDGTISVDPTIIPEVIEYEAGTAISIEEVEHGGVIIDAWDDGTGWSNWAYTTTTGDGGISWNPEVHSSVADSWKIPLGATQVRVKALSTSDVLLHPTMHWLTGQGTGRFGYSCPTGAMPYDSWIDVNSNATYMNLGIRRTEGSNVSLSPSEVKSVELTFQTASEIEVDVWDSGTGWVNGTYTDLTSNSFTGWPRCVHSPVTSTNTLYPVLSDIVRVVARDVNDDLLSVRIELHDGSGVRYRGYEYIQDERDFNLRTYCEDNNLAFPEYISIGLLTLQNPNTSNFSPSSVGRVSLLWKLPALEIGQAINVKYGNGLTVNQNNELEVNIGTGLEFDQTTGAINVTGGGGDTIAEGDGISITDDQQTGDKIISVNYGDGLTIDPVTGALMFDGQLPEGTIIKKLTYIGDGGATNNIQFEKKPIAILSIYGAGQGTKVSSCVAPIDAPVLNVSYGTGNGSSSAGMVSCTMSYNDTTNVLSLTGGNDPGVRCNMSGETYTVYYLIKGHTEGGTSATNEVSVIKTISYTGTGTSTNNIQLPETPDYILGINGRDGVSGDMVVFPFDPIHATPAHQYIYTYCYNSGISTNYFAGGHGEFTFNSSTNILTLTGGDQGAACNYLDRVYYLRYVVNETISSYEYSEGGGISITPDPQTGENIISVNIGSGLAFDPQTGAINVTGGGGGSGDTVAEGAGIEITTDQQTGNKVIAVNPGSGLQVNQTTNELEVSSGVVTSIAPTQNTPGSITVTEGDGTATPVSVISQMGGATSSTAGTAGYVPAPAAGDDDAYLRGDGTWDDSVVTEDDELTLVFVPDDYQPS